MFADVNECTVKSMTLAQEYLEKLLFCHCCGQRGEKPPWIKKKLIRCILSPHKATRKRHLSMTELELVNEAQQTVRISSTELHMSSAAAGNLEYMHKCMNTWR